MFETHAQHWCERFKIQGGQVETEDHTVGRVDGGWQSKRTQPCEVEEKITMNCSDVKTMQVWQELQRCGSCELGMGGHVAADLRFVALGSWLDGGCFDEGHAVEAEPRVEAGAGIVHCVEPRAVER